MKELIKAEEEKTLFIVLCGVQNTNPGEEPLPLYRFPGGVSLA